MGFKHAVASLLMLASTAHAASIEKPLNDPAQEQTARTIFRELKCVVCEGQSLAESDATLARQMRERIRDMVGQGKSEQQVLDYFREHYGEQILMTPQLQPLTALLWGAPLLLLGFGAVLVWRTTRRAGDPT